MPTSAVAAMPLVSENCETAPVLGSNSASAQYPSFLPETVTASMPVQMMQASRSMPSLRAAAASKESFASGTASTPS